MKPPGLPRILVLGGGELGSAVSHRLTAAGFDVAIADLEHPACIRRRVCFAEAVREGRKRVEGVVATSVPSAGGASGAIARGEIPVIALADGAADYGRLAADLGADVVVDARMLKRNQGMSPRIASMVIGLGPGFRAPEDVHAVVETNRGPGLGSVIYRGSAEADTGLPAPVAGRAGERVIRAPVSGVFRSSAGLGEAVAEGEVVGTVEIGDENRAAGGSAAARAPEGATQGVPVTASIAGLLRGLAADGLRVERGQKIGDVDPRGSTVDPDRISDKGRAVAGGVLEAVMHWWVTCDDRF
ncbi:MAG: molybdenum hydroxylase [bacterium]